MTNWSLRFGAGVEESGIQFRLWAPRLRSPSVLIRGNRLRILPMQLENDGEFGCFAHGVRAGSDYAFLTDGRELPDPVSRWQPHGVHGPSRIVDPSGFSWSDQAWRGVPLKDYLIYELHTGTFTPEGTFEGIVPRLHYLRELGVTAVELMPVAEFPGRRNWGYDGVGLYAPQSTYGGPQGLKTLIDECHGAGLAFILDVVYNHVGPEGNYLSQFAPYFTNAYRTPWGDAINYDGADSDGVRRFFVDNALYWLTEYHVDALRLDGIHGIFDFSARHILEELTEAFHAQAQRLDRLAWLIAESDLNNARVIKPPSLGGYGVDSQWLDEFHHSLHTSLTSDTREYFGDFGGLSSLRETLMNGYVYEGQYSQFRRRRHGSSSSDRPGEQFVVFSQNHDQVANAFSGSRSSTLLSVQQQKLAAAVLLCSPFIPLLFMGQEYGETAGFYYFTDHLDQTLVEAVREGRRKEAGTLLADGGFLDPQDSNTFDRSQLNWDSIGEPVHAGVLAWYRDLIAARRQCPALSNCRKDLVQVDSNTRDRWLIVQRQDPSGSCAMLVCNFSEAPQAIPIQSTGLSWSLRLWSGAAYYWSTAVAPLIEIPAGETIRAALPGSSAALYIAR